MKFGLLALISFALTFVAAAPIHAPDTPSWSPDSPSLRTIEVDGRIYIISPSDLSSFLSPYNGANEFHGVDAHVIPTDKYHRTIFTPVRDAVAWGYQALGDRRIYAAVMLVVALLNFSSIVLVLLFCQRTREQEETSRSEEGLVHEGEEKVVLKE
ncbi:hypothetical protein CcaverHIS002_0407880 [Cutaneotrichosporon cavernicola]|uniref:Uncharacterized protein n=1 Tax=Cutaneotrichosporon cavernicola TaxID=279322 RepID=A0AA48QW44_9TREE|nr:uncharacterized protein CcaverHIS019_0407860 [Cutaneotrichosporon cavernicola]BEI84184.1 hypothetical protein CcaverHIS002_0407880 [Cutaneotrichosporon cavernicola]BEI91966.1 hypothetical protein CcaverHIS019_0407860 [Cutaneotrichosporon cavernicola]BEI99737.1 hypothetical protein CcaverHIS631_0407800 [Cutaneotrichosporon cavernicola]BEJ07513.1 hypothetical protein CcaverHIS641_0407820 [Cutaneotrichosporon cavernicola]